MTLCLVILGSLSYVEPPLLAHWSYAAVSSLFLFGFCYGAGVGPCAFNVAQEIFPMEGRSFGCTLAQAIRYAFVFVDIYQVVQNILFEIFHRQAN